ncbi:MAG: peptidyl-prolyl cis-trans isomerase [Litorimonas sp.]
MSRRLFRDPLIHFLLFGAALFAAHAAWSHFVTRADRQLVVDTREIARQSDLFVIENGRAPSEAELQGIIVSYVEEEVLAREAQALGLDEDDTVVRRRLAQKMRLLSDAGIIPAPSEAELQAWFEDRQVDYLQPERRTIQHVFFSDDRRDDAKADAAAADLSDWSRVGDPFIIARQLGPVDSVKVQQDYGGAFAVAAFETEIDVWSDPVRSPFGIHRLRVTDMKPRVEPNLVDIRDRVLSDWMDEARRTRARQAVRDRIAKYDVIVEE